MTRPKSDYNIQACYQSHYYSCDSDSACGWGTVELNMEEMEALRLKNIEGLDQTEAAREMRISQSTLQRILSSAYRKVSEALVQGKSIKIVGVDSKKSE